MAVGLVENLKLKNLEVSKEVQIEDTDKVMLSRLYFELWKFSHDDWKILKRTSPEEINAPFLSSLLGDLHLTLQDIKTYERRRNEQRYKYVSDAEKIFEAVKKSMEEQKETYSPKELLTKTLPGFIALNDIAESHFILTSKMNQSEIQQLKNLLVERINKSIDDAEEKITGGLRSIDIPKAYYTYFLLDIFDSLPENRILDGHGKLWYKIRNRTNDIEDAVKYVVSLGKYGHLREAHYPYVLYTLLNNLKRDSSTSIV